MQHGTCQGMSRFFAPERLGGGIVYKGWGLAGVGKFMLREG